MPIVDTIYRNPSRWRAVIHTQDVRHGTAGCLLSVILFAPLFVRQYGMLTIATVVLVYCLLIVPALTNYFSPLKYFFKIGRKLADIFSKMRGWFCCRQMDTTATRSQNSSLQLAESGGDLFDMVSHTVAVVVCCPFTCFIPYIHEFYLSIEGFRITSNQVVFFILCEKLLSPEARLSSLYFLLFYTVLAYLHKSLVTRQWSQSFYETNIQDFLKLTTWFIAVRLAKGVAMAFVLIIFTMQFNNVEPNVTFILVTFIYFLLTQKKWTGNERIVAWISCLQIDVFEEDEEYWIPFLMKTIPPFTSLIPILTLVPNQKLLCLIAFYTNLMVPLLLLKKQFEEKHYENSVSLLTLRKATKEELNEFSSCPICLDTMRHGRVTHCNHVYHANCLKKCLASSNLCPMCKRSLC